MVGSKRYSRGDGWRRLLAALAVLAALMAAGVALTPAQAALASRRLTLAEALRAAETGNPGYRRACLAVDQAELALERLRADQAVRAGALALQQAVGTKATAQVAQEAARRRLWLDVRRAYYTLLTAHKQREVAREALEQVKEQDRAVKRRRAAGAATQLDVLAIQRALAEATAGVERAETGVRLAELNLLDLLGWPADTQVELDQGVTDFVAVPGEAAAIRLALERSPELRQTREAVEAARLGVSLAENDYTPELARKAAELKLEEARLAAEEVERRLALQVRRVLADLELAETQVEAAVKATAAAAEGWRAAQVRFEAGVSGTEELLAAQVRLTQARQAELQARLDYDLARTGLFSLIGE
ncbi:MAG: TolC family protein [Betaproteobacteria bacterium]